MVATAQEPKPKNALTLLSNHLETLKKQIGLVLPKHMTPDRMARLALTAFSAEPKLHLCTFESVAASVIVASQMGLEIGVGGQGWIVPYGTTATFVPGWMGLIELLNRSGRGSAWTGAIYDGDWYDCELGDSPFLKHKPCGSKDKITHVYAIGRSKGGDWPIIEVWNMPSVVTHRDRYNKVGKKHYSYANENNWEMYARKVALLQVLKYLPKSIELQAAIDASNAADMGEAYTVDADFVVAVPKQPQVDTDMDGLTDDLEKKKANRDQRQAESGKGDRKEEAAETGKDKPQDKAADKSVEKTTEKAADQHVSQVADDEPDIIGDFRRRVDACDSEEDLEIVRLSIKKSKSLGPDEKRFLERAVDSRRAAL